MLKRVSLIILLLSFLPAAGCSPLGVAAVGVGARTGAAATREGGLSQALTDAKIQAQINDAWFRYDVETFRKLDMTVTQGRVLLTGVVQNPEARVEAVRLAWQPKGVTQVINEIRVAESEGLKGYARDTWITTRLRAAIVWDKEIQSINYNIDTVSGVVYLMGQALSQVELDKVIQTARTIPNVKQVVSYVKVIGTDAPAATPQPNDLGTPYDSTTVNDGDDFPKAVRVQDDPYKSYNDTQARGVTLGDPPSAELQPVETEVLQ